MAGPIFKPKIEKTELTEHGEVSLMRLTNYLNLSIDETESLGESIIKAEKIVSRHQKFFDSIGPKRELPIEKRVDIRQILFDLVVLSVYQGVEEKKINKVLKDMEKSKIKSTFYFARNINDPIVSRYRDYRVKLEVGKSLVIDLY